MNKSDLESKHISELHSLAAAAGIERFRMLRREQLIESLIGSEGKGSANGGGRNGRSGRAADGERTRRGRSGSTRGSSRDESGSGRGEGEGRRRRRRRGDSNGEDQAPSGHEAEKRDSKTEETAAVSGTLEIGSQGSGLIADKQGSVYVSTAQIRRCKLRSGDVVEGPARQARRGERHRTLLRVEKVNGSEPGPKRGPAFDQLTPITPTRRIPLNIPGDDVLTRAAELLAPLAFGQRVLIRAEPRSGRSTLLRGLARAILAGPAEVGVVALLVDERPEEVTEWRQQVEGAEIEAASADTTPKKQLQLAESVLTQVKRRAESGEDVVLILDSLTRLAVAAGEAAVVKPFFGAGRDLAEPGAGSLTVIAVALSGSEEGAEVARAVATTESTSLDLSAKLAAESLVPSLIAIRPSVAGEELLREGDELAAARRLRSELRLMPAEEAARRLADRIRSTSANAELLR